jgi:GDP-L-fucose synthase
MTKIFVAGHNGMVGSALCRQLKNQDAELVTACRNELDLTSQVQVKDFLNSHKVDQVYLAAAKVGGIHANNEFPADFIYENLMMEANIIHYSYLSGVKKLMFLGSSCIYPKNSAQPINEKELMTGQLELTNEPYAIAKIAGIKLCESYNRQYGVDYRCVMPTNLYGPMDNFHSENSHVMPALLRRIHEAKTQQKKEVIVWGTGKPKREFLHVDDMANATLHLMNMDADSYWLKTNQRLSHINVGTGIDTSIETLVSMIKSIVGYEGSIVFDHSKPDGTMRKLIDISYIKSLGWEPNIDLSDGISATYKWYLENQNIVRL